MAVRYRTMSENFWAAVAAGAGNYFVHIDSGLTGRITIKPVTDSKGNVTKPIILQSVTVNSSGGSGAFVVTDSGQGIVSQLKASVQEKDYHYTCMMRGNILLDPNGGDETVVYTRD